MDSIGAPYTLFWRRLSSLASSDPNVFKLIVQRLDDQGGYLRRVCRESRLFVNQTVCSIHVSWESSRSSPAGTDLADTFPYADQLYVSLPAETEQAVLALGTITTESPRLLHKLRILKICWCENQSEGLQAALAGCLARCHRLQEMDVFARFLHCHFTARGVGASTQSSAMGQQLLAQSTTTTFLAPATWPQHQCLSALALHCGAATACYLDAALCTPSLLSLDIGTSDDFPAERYCSLQALTALTALTNLAVQVQQPAFLPHPSFLPAVSALGRLRALRVTNGPSARADSEPGACPVVDLAWSRITRLTELSLGALAVDLGALRPLAALRVLALPGCMAVGGLGSLLGLTALTRLVGPARRSTSAGQAAGDGSVVPLGWKQGLQQLTWPACSADLPLMAQLTSLRQLHLITAEVCPAFCRMLASLPLLWSLSLKGATVPAGAPLPAPPLAARALLPSLANFNLAQSEGSMHALHILARWTRVHPGAAFTLSATRDLLSCTVAVRGWSPGWLRALLLHDQELCRVGATTVYPAGYALVDDDDVDRFSDAARGLAVSYTLFLGREVTPASLGRLAAAAHTREASLDRMAGDGDAVPPYVLQWDQPLATTSEHFAAMGGAELTCLYVSDCALVGDEGLRALAGAARALCEVDFGQAGKLGDKALWALCAGCRGLKMVMLSGLVGVSGGGLLPLLTTLDTLQVLKVAWVSDELEGRVLGAVTELYPDLVDQWVVEKGVDGVTFSRVASLTALLAG